MKRKDMRLAIIDAVYKTCAESGLEKTTIKRISVAAKTSQNVIYRHFISKEELFETAFYDINCQIDAVMKDTFFKSFPIGAQASNLEISLMLWNVYLDYWIGNPQKTLFYDNIIHSNYITRDVWVKQSESFKFFTQLVLKLKDSVSDLKGEMEGFSFLMMLVINSAIMLATSALKTGLPVPNAANQIIQKIITMIFMSA